MSERRVERLYALYSSLQMGGMVIARIAELLRNTTLRAASDLRNPMKRERQRE
jgi:hypothetical protein